MTTLRDEIERRVQDAMNMSPDEYDGYLAYDTADAILALVREALLGDEAITVVATWLHGEHGGISREFMRNMLSDTLDTITGAQP